MLGSGHSTGGLGTLLLVLSLLIADLGCDTALSSDPRGTSLLWRGWGWGSPWRTLSSGWTAAPEKCYISKPPLTPLLCCSPSFQHVKFSWGRRRSHSHLTFSSAFCREITMGSDTVVRNNIERSQIPFFYLAPIIVSYKSLVWINTIVTFV